MIYSMDPGNGASDALDAENLAKCLSPMCVTLRQHQAFTVVSFNGFRVSSLATGKPALGPLRYEQHNMSYLT